MTMMMMMMTTTMMMMPMHNFAVYLFVPKLGLQILGWNRERKRVPSAICRPTLPRFSPMLPKVEFDETVYCNRNMQANFAQNQSNAGPNIPEYINLT